MLGFTCWDVKKSRFLHPCWAPVSYGDSIHGLGVLKIVQIPTTCKWKIPHLLCFEFWGTLLKISGHCRIKSSLRGGLRNRPWSRPKALEKVSAWPWSLRSPRDIFRRPTLSTDMVQRVCWWKTKYVTRMYSILQLHIVSDTQYHKQCRLIYILLNWLRCHIIEKGVTRTN
jgi:hypothetical protein